MSHTAGADPAAAAGALKQLLELHEDARIVKYCAMAADSWLVLDFIMMLPTEIQYVWNTRWNLSRLLFLWVRLFGIVLLTVNFGVTMTGGHSVQVGYKSCRHSSNRSNYDPTRRCEFYFYWEGTAGSLMMWSVHVILQLRIYAMYRGSKRLAIFNIVFFIAEIITILIVYNYGISIGTTLATPPGLTGCYGITTSFLFSIWLPALAFDMWLVVLALWKAVERSREGVVVNGQRLDLLAVLIRDNVIYFMVIALGLLANTIMWFAAPDGLAAAAVPISHASMIISGSRLLLNLFEASHRSLNVTRTMTGMVTQDRSTLMFCASTDEGISRRGRWTDISMLTGEFAATALDLSADTDVDDGLADAQDSDSSEKVDGLRKAVRRGELNEATEV
ncbi:hypothetical protein BV20DRAFT_1051330 [Pilatotrama ljubarskyi]|nr:hypothetical protein BV20DRAFT_1051330 [Pilatotrama ljubarskyi]